IYNCKLLININNANVHLINIVYSIYLLYVVNNYTKYPPSCARWLINKQ
ncbi:hypothetical protein G210_5224, partial [Candida maltosa Xu316]